MGLICKSGAADNYILSISINNNYISLSIVKDSKINKFKIYAYENYLIKDYTIYNSVIYNQTVIAEIIKDFLIKYSIKDPRTIICINDENILECLNQELFTAKIKKPNSIDRFCTVKQELQFYPYSVNYFVAINYFRIIQLNLLSVNLSLNILSITTSFIALYYVYKIYGVKKVVPRTDSVDTLKNFFKITVKDQASYLRNNFLKNSSSNNLIDKEKFISLDEVLISLGAYFIGQLT